MAGITELVNQLMQDARQPALSGPPTLAQAQEIARRARFTQDRLYEILQQVGTNEEDVITIKADLETIQAALITVQSDITALYSLVASGGGGGSGGAASITDYVYHLTGALNGINTNFQTRFGFI